jgi:acyl-CoA synthetase (AMP-forming)/AMP-acid ligase II
MFWEFRRADPEAIALIAPDGDPVTYLELAAMAEDWSERLRTAAGSRSAIVAIEMEATLDAIGAYLGALRAKLPILLLEPSTDTKESRVASFWQPEVVVRSGRILTSIDRALTEEETEAIHPDLGLLLSTSGTTGDPKLVRLSLENIASNATAIVEYLGLTASDCAITSLPLFYSYGLSVLNSYLEAGATIVLTDSKILDPSFWALCQRAEVTSLALVPHQIELLASGNLHRLALPSLRYITQAGGKLPSDLATQFWEVGRSHGWDFFIMYGQTEASPRMSYVPPKLLPEASDTIGVAIPGGTIDLVAADGKPITDPHVAGELIYRGPNVMMGYAECRKDLSKGKEVFALETGDIAEITDSGLFRIVGRKKRFAKLFGLRISLDRTEEILRQSGISAFVIAAEETIVVLHVDANVGSKAQRLVEEAYDLPPGTILTAYIESVPYAPSGKPDMRVLAGIAERLVLEKANSGLGDLSIQQALAKATRQKVLDPDDSFNSLGGDSLSYIQMQMTLEEKLQDVPDDWADIPLKRLEALAAEMNGQSSTITAVPFDILLRISAIALIVAQHASDLPIYGGVWMLIALMGASAARFQQKKLLEGRPLLVAWRMLYPIIPAYLLLLLLYSHFRSEVPLEYLLLVGNYYVFAEGSLLTAYWFVSFYAQVVLFLVLIAAFPPLRRTFARSSFTFNAVLATLLTVLIAIFDLWLGLRSGPYVLWPVEFIGSHGFFRCLPIFLIGWCLQSADSTRLTIISILVATAYLAYFYLSVGGAFKLLLLALTFVAIARPLKIRLPVGWSRFLTTLASATLFVYLLHPAVVYFTNGLPVSELSRVVVALTASFALAVLGNLGFAAIEGYLIGFRHRAKRSVAGGVPITR